MNRLRPEPARRAPALWLVALLLLVQVVGHLGHAAFHKRTRTGHGTRPAVHATRPAPATVPCVVCQLTLQPRIAPDTAPLAAPRCITAIVATPPTVATPVVLRRLHASLASRAPPAS